MSATDGFTAALPAKLAVQHVSKWFRTPRASVHALDDVSLDVDGGEFVCLLGPSGCGKSTLLDIIAGLTLPDKGQVLADDIRVQGPGRHRLVMFQESALFPWLNVFGNVMFGLRRAAGLSAAQQRQIADYHLNLVGLAKFKKAYVHELSGGMKQRAAREAVCLGDRVALMSPSPGRIREEFAVKLPRPRDINTAEVAALAQRITSALKGL